MNRLALSPRFAAVASVLGPPVAVLVGGFALVLAISSDPILAYKDLLFANFYSASNFALFVNRTTPLLLVGLSVVLSFRAGVFNVGGEGQLYLGAVARHRRGPRLGARASARSGSSRRRRRARRSGRSMR